MAAKRVSLLSPRALARRLDELEAEVQECRQLNVRLAELCDLMVELAVPVNQNDEGAVAELVERYRREVGGGASTA